MKVVHLIVDAAGDYEVAADDRLATARRRRDGWWDQRTKSGRAAQALFREREDERYWQMLKDEVLRDIPA